MHTCIHECMRADIYTERSYIIMYIVHMLPSFAVHTYMDNDTCIPNFYVCSTVMLFTKTFSAIFISFYKLYVVVSMISFGCV